MRGYIEAELKDLNQGNTLTFAQDTFTVFYQKEKYVTGNKVKVLEPKFENLDDINAIFILASINNSIRNLSWGTGSDVNMIENIKFELPIKEGKIDFKFIDHFVAELEAQHIAELEAQHIAELEAYLTVTGLKDYSLTEEEKNVIDSYYNLKWDKFNLEKLFGKSTRGKRLKSADRLPGKLPFVTAGEADEGISAYIGNDVEIFEKNTTTIDMFGSAKYRNYNYGGDDHIAVVHTEKLPKKSSIFVTTAIHKSSHNGQFDYGRNFYAKDADLLYISLPVKDNKPDYKIMELIISAVHKLVIKDVVEYADKKINATKQVINNDKNYNNLLIVAEDDEQFE